MKFSNALGGGGLSLEKKPKKVFSVDETQKENYPQLCGVDFPPMSSAGLPTPSKPTWQSRMSDHREEILWKMLETGNPELVPINSIAALSVWGSPMRSRLCASGKIPAIKVADQWFSSSQMVIDALKNHHEKSKAFALMPPATPRKRGRPRARN